MLCFRRYNTYICYYTTGWPLFKKTKPSEMHILKWLLESTTVDCLFDGRTVEGCVVIYKDSMYAPFIARHTSILYPIFCPPKHIRLNRCSRVQNASFQYVAVSWQTVTRTKFLMRLAQKKKSYGVIAGDIGGGFTLSEESPSGPIQRSDEFPLRFVRTAL